MALVQPCIQATSQCGPYQYKDFSSPMSVSDERQMQFGKPTLIQASYTYQYIGMFLLHSNV